MTKRTIGCFLALFVVFLLTNCDQYPIFYTIATEPEPREALIKGSPSKIVLVTESAGSYFYVANGSLWKTPLSGGTAGTWQKTEKPGAVRDIELVGDYLYALTLDGSTLSLFRKNIKQTAGWQAVSAAANPQRIYVGRFAGEDILFIGVGAASSGTVWQYKSNSASQVSGVSGELRGAASTSTTVYLATLDNGIWTYNNGTAAQVSGTSSREITGIISIDNVVIAVDANGGLYNSSTGNWTTRDDYEFTGALAVWDNGADRTLLAGVHAVSSSYTYGYFEASLASGAGAITASSFATPALSIGGQESEYTSSVGKHPINHLAVTPAPPPASSLPVIFASTQKDGLWAYRGEWNAEK